MNIPPILAAAVIMAPSNLPSDTNDLLDQVLPILAMVGPGLIVMIIMVIMTLRKNIPR
jgi:hypothetical protein